MEPKSMRLLMTNHHFHRAVERACKAPKSQDKTPRKDVRSEEGWGGKAEDCFYSKIPWGICGKHNT